MGPLQDANNSLSTASNNNNSLSLHTTDLNYSVSAAVPIHCSTIDGMGPGLQDQKEMAASQRSPNLKALLIPLSAMSQVGLLLFCCCFAINR